MSVGSMTGLAIFPSAIFNRSSHAATVARLSAYVNQKALLTILLPTRRAALMVAEARGLAT